MNVIIVAANRNKHPVAVMPFGACLVAEAAERAGHRVVFLDLMFKRDPGAALAQVLRRAQPDVVGISVRNIDNNDMRHSVMFFEEIRPLTDIIRATTRAAVVLGGAAVGVMPEALLRYSGADFVVQGHGPFVFPQFLFACGTGRKWETVNGLGWIENGIYRQTPRADPCSAENYPVPRYKRWIDTGAYLSRFSSAPLQTKQGCPFKCVYCTYSMSEGNKYRLFSPESVVRDVRALAAQGLTEIEFVDNVFNAPYAHALSVCRSLAAASTGAHFQTVELNPRFIDKPLLYAMTGAGFTGIGITAESAADPVLSGLGKGYTSEDVRRAAILVARSPLPAFWMFMLGGPGETKETVLRTIHFAEDYLRPNDIAFFNVGIRIYPGTQLEKIARQEGVLTVPPGEMLRTVTYVSPNIDAAWITAAVCRAVEKHDNFIHSDSLNLPFLPALFRIGHMVGFRQPLWKHIRILRKTLRTIGANV